MPVVHVNLIKGRTKEQKALMADEISETIHKHSGEPKEVVIVTFNDVEPDSWAQGGTLFSDK